MPDMTQQGVETANALTADQRMAASYDALLKAYGPAIAYDPKNALTAAQASAETPLAPAEAQNALATNQANLQGKQLENTDTARQQAALGASRGFGMAMAAAGPNADSLDPDEFDKNVAPFASALGVSPDQLAQIKAQVTAPGGIEHAGALRQALLTGQPVTGAPITRLNADGTTSILQPLKTGGFAETNLGAGSTTTQGATAQTGQGKLALGQAQLEERKQQDAYLRAHGWTMAQIADFRAGTTANNSQYGAGDQQQPVVPAGGGGPAPRVPAAGGAAPAGGKAPAPNVAQPLFNRLPEGSRARATAIGQAQTIANSDTNTGTANQIIDSISKQASAYNTGAGSWTDFMRGGSASNLRANVQALRGQIGSAIISSMKNSQGQMGFRMSNAEFKTLTDSLGALGTEQSLDQFKQHVEYVKNAINNFNKTAHQGFQKQWGLDAGEALGNKPSLPGGFTYIGPVKK